MLTSDARVTLVVMVPSAIFCHLDGPEQKPYLGRVTRARRESRRKKDARQLQKPSKWPSRPLKAKRRRSCVIQQQGCHFCTKGCQNPRARGSQGAAARDLPGPVALETRDAPTNRTSSKKSQRRGKAPATRRVTQKWTPSRRPATTARPSSACRRSTRSTGAAATAAR